MQGFATALSDLADDPSALPAMAQAARARVDSHFLWARKAEQIAQIYDWLRGGAPQPAPRFF